MRLKLNSQARLNTLRHHRSAFTLIEVLVVVTIIVILASVGTIATLKYLEEAKMDKARMDMANLEKTFKTTATKLDVPFSQMDYSFVDYMEQGEQSLQSPWSAYGQQYDYQFRIIEGQNGEERVQFFCLVPNNSSVSEIVWPTK